jgi:hypothetical protein
MVYRPWQMRCVGAATMLAAAVMVALGTTRSAAPEALRPEPPVHDPAEVPVAWFDHLYDVVQAEQIAPPRPRASMA